jgi:4a-hydroxytetrahydrobiopterin dehydratase
VDTLTNEEIREAGLADWRKLAQALYARFRTPDYAAGAAFATAVSGVVEAENQHLEVRLAPGLVDVIVGTRQDGLWVTGRDITLAQQISQIARDSGLAAEPTAVTQLEIALDTAHEDRIGPFWAALLTGDPSNKIHDAVLDPTGSVPAMWFQPTEEHETPRQRWHFDLWLAPEVADERIATAVSAGGTVVDDSWAPSFTVLADPDGNRVCVCTPLDRA